MVLDFGSRSEFRYLESHQTASSLHGKMHQKWCAAALWVGKCTGANSGGDTQHQGSETAVQLLASIALTDAAALQNGAVSFPQWLNMKLRGWSHTIQPKVTGQLLAPPREPIRFSTNTRIMRSSSSRRGEANCNALLFKPPIPPLSLLSRSPSATSGFPVLFQRRALLPLTL